MANKEVVAGKCKIMMSDKIHLDLKHSHTICVKLVKVLSYLNKKCPNVGSVWVNMDRGIVTDRHYILVILYVHPTVCLTPSQTSPGFYVSAVQVF